MLLASRLVLLSPISSAPVPVLIIASARPQRLNSSRPPPHPVLTGCPARCLVRQPGLASLSPS
eukprot:150187-Rhodomonas_salina.1